MASDHHRPHTLKARWPRRVLQLLVLAVLVYVPWATSNPEVWSPSRIVLGMLPPPTAVPVAGDTWSFTIGDFSLIHPLAFIEAWLSSKKLYLPLVLAVVIPLGLTLVLGRVFCSWLCPVGFVLELNMRVNRFLRRHGLAKDTKVKDFRYPILFIFFALALLLAFPVLSIFDPPHLLGRELMYLFTHREVSLLAVGFFGVVLALEMFVASRLLCNSFCPSGGGLALLGKKRPVRIGMAPDKCIHCAKCDETCPYDLQPMNLAEQGAFDWTKCDNCGRCRDACPTAAISYTVGSPPRQSTRKEVST